MVAKIARGARGVLVLALAAVVILGAHASSDYPAREVVKFDFAWRTFKSPMKANCPAHTFINKSGVQCDGLSASSAATPEQCQDVCCADPSCDIWQFENRSVSGGGCWTGKCDGAQNPNNHWIGGQRNGSSPSNHTTPAPAQPNFPDASWDLVDVPHDFIVNSEFDANDPASGRSYLPRNSSWYRKHFTVPSEWKGQAIWVYFEGVFRISKVWVNGQFAVEHDCGYTSFAVRLDNTTLNYGDSGENVLAIYVDAESGSGWWYEGGGINRHVWLVKAPPVHFDTFGLFAYANVTGATARADPGAGLLARSATVHASASVVNHGNASSTGCVHFTVVDENNGGQTKGSGLSSSFTVTPGAGAHVTASFPVDKPELWSIPRPYLYTLQASLGPCSLASRPAAAAAAGGDSLNITTGFRTIKFTPDNGLYLNEQNVKVRGFCDHNDFASVGVAVPDRINLFRAQGMRSVGGNGWRMSHNPPIPLLLDILDRVGIVVMDENRLFGDDPAYAHNMGQLVQRDRNHPSVIIWSFCNEAGCEGSAEKGGPAFQNVTYFFDGSRPTLANMFSYGDLLGNTIDVQGFSHRPRSQVDEFHKAFPHKPQFMSECCSCNTQRGEDVAVSGKTQSNFNAPCQESQTNASNGVPYDSGTMVWTLFDYMGEPSFGGWPHVSSTFGSFDLTGFAKAAVYWFRSYWLYSIPDAAADKPFQTADNHVVHIVQGWERPPPPPPPSPSMFALYGVACGDNDNFHIAFTEGHITKQINGEAYCLTANASSSGAQDPVLPFEACSPTDPRQTFAYDATLKSFKSQTAGECLDLWGAIGPNVGLYSCNNQNNQQWEMVDNTIRSLVAGTPKCMSDSTTPGSGGQVRSINAYTDAPAIELFVNGKSHGLQFPVTPGAGGPSYAQWNNVQYEAGNLTAVARDMHNKSLGSHTVASSEGVPASIQLQIDAPNNKTGTGTSIVLDGQDVALLRAIIVDKHGVMVRKASNNVSFSVVSGDARILGAHNGDPTCHEPNHAPWHSAYNGLVRGIVQVTTDASSDGWHRNRLLSIDVDGGKRTKVVKPGQAYTASPLVIAASSPGLPSVEITIPVSTSQTDSVLSVAARSVQPVFFD